MSGLREALEHEIGEHVVGWLQPNAAGCSCGWKGSDPNAGIRSLAEWRVHMADAVLRVLAEHGDTQQVREQVHEAIADAVVRRTALTDGLVDAVMTVVARTVAERDAANEEARKAKRWLIDAAGADVTDLLQSLDDCTARAERAEADLAAANAQLERYDGQAWDDLQADLAAARQQLEQVRGAFRQWSGGPDDEFERTMRALIDAPARPAGHDESGQP